MRTKVIVCVITFVVIAGIWYANTVNNQKTGLQQSNERLTIVERHIGTGNLKGANSLLIQIEIDLRDIDKFYTLPSIHRTRQELSNRRNNLQNRFNNRLRGIERILGNVTDSIKSGALLKANDEIRTALSTISDKDATLIAIARYVDRLRVQDFKGADATISQVRANFPEELGVVEIAKVLRELVESERKTNRETQSRIAAEVKSWVDLRRVRASYTFTPVLEGRAMVWDFTKNKVDPAYELLPDDLRASSRDGNVTMFCILKRENIEVGRYSISNQPAYKEKMTIGVVYWPKKVSPGTTVVWGGEPPRSRPVKYSPEYGSSVKIKEWIEGLPTK